MVNGDTVAQPGDRAEVIAKFVAADARVRRGDERYPYLDGLGCVVGIAEIRRHHADDVERSKLARQLLADHVAIAAESPQPQPMADQRDELAARHFVLDCERTSEQRHASEHIKVICRHPSRRQPLREVFAGCLDSDLGPRGRGQTSKHVLALAPIEELLRRYEKVTSYRPETLSGRLADPDQAIRMGIRQRS